MPYNILSVHKKLLLIIEGVIIWINLKNSFQYVSTFFTIVVTLIRILDSSLIIAEQVPTLITNRLMENLF